MRSFLLLEDDNVVDWEVDRQGERIGVDHPHRAPLQGRAAAARRDRRRPGQPAPPKHVCLSPIECADAAHGPRRRRPAQGSFGARNSGSSTSWPPHASEA
jgi:hypothetical protein